MAGIVIAIIGLVTGIGTGCADQIILHPTRNPIDAHGAERREIAHAGGFIEIFVARSFNDANPPDAYVLEFTGNGTRAEQIARYVADRWKPHRVEAWTMNYPGYGQSTGPARMKAIAPAALQTFDALSQQAHGKPIFVCGNSLGCTSAVYVASQRTVAGVIVQNPPALHEIIMHEGWWNLWLLAVPVAAQVPAELEAPAHAKLIRAPAIFITSDADSLVIPKFQQLTIDAYAGLKRRIHLNNKGHNDGITTPEEKQLFNDDVNWLWTNGR